MASDWNFADSQTGEVKGASCGNSHTRGRETILAIGARGHMASDWNFTDLHIGGVKGI
jgi:hypothetical protein